MAAVELGLALAMSVAGGKGGLEEAADAVDGGLGDVVAPGRERGGIRRVGELEIGLGSGGETRVKRYASVSGG